MVGLYRFHFFLNLLVYLLPVYRYLIRCRDPDPDLVALDAQDSDLDVVTNAGEGYVVLITWRR